MKRPDFLRDEEPNVLLRTHGLGYGKTNSHKEKKL